jgi:hypothetical protein
MALEEHLGAPVELAATSQHVGPLEAVLEDLADDAEVHGRGLGHRARALVDCTSASQSFVSTLMFVVRLLDQGGRTRSFQIPCRLVGCVPDRELAIRR